MFYVTSAEAEFVRVMPSYVKVLLSEDNKCAYVVIIERSTFYWMKMTIFNE